MILDFGNPSKPLRSFRVIIRPATMRSTLFNGPGTVGNIRSATITTPIVRDLTEQQRPIRFDAEYGFVEADDRPLNPYARAFCVVWLLATLAAVCAPYIHP